MKDENNDIVKELIARHLAGETSITEEKQLLDWIAQSPENEQNYLAFKKVYELSGQHYAAKTTKAININIDKEWSHFVNNINEKDKTVRSLIPDNRSPQLWYKIAATVLLLLVAGYLLNYYIKKTSDIQFETADNTRTLSLPDGSQIILNKHSQIAYTSDFGKHNRKVKLIGEAFFDIKRDTLKPFIITVNKTTIEVLGTSFNVRAYDDLNEVEVIVQTGVVKLTVPERKTEVKLTAGQKGIYSKINEQLSSSTNDDVNFLAWNTQKIIFIETDLHTVIETLSKTYQVNIIVSTDIPASCEVTVSFDHQTLESVLHVLERTLNLTYKINGNQIEITGAGC